jgi:hypothetical protein
MKLIIWPERNVKIIERNSCMDDGCVADFTTDYRNFSDVGTFY